MESSEAGDGRRAPAARASDPATALLPAWEVVLPQHENRDHQESRPSMRYSHTATVIGEEVIFAFGYFYDHWGPGATWHSDVWALSAAPGVPAEQRWRRITQGLGPEDPPPRMNHVAGAPRGDAKLLVFGGSGVDEQGYNDLWELDVPSASWRRRALTCKPPEARSCSAAVAAGSSLLLYGGFHLGDLWRYGCDEDCWELLMEAPQEDHEGHPGKRAGHSAVLSADCARMLVYGGFRFDSDVSDIRFGVGKLSDLWLYAIAEKRWERLPQIGGTQGGRQFFGMQLVPWWKSGPSEDASTKPDGEALAVFGGTQVNPVCKLVGSLTLYSLEEQRWYLVKVQEEPLHRYHHNMAFSENALWIHGGESYHPHVYHNSLSCFSWPPPRSAVVLADVTSASP